MKQDLLTFGWFSINDSHGMMVDDNDPLPARAMCEVELVTDSPRVCFGLVQAQPPAGSGKLPVLAMYSDPMDIVYEAATSGWKIVRAYLVTCEPGVDLGTTIEPLDRILEVAVPSDDNLWFIFVTASGRQIPFVRAGSFDPDIQPNEVYRFSPAAAVTSHASNG